jgi:hypothetical protein
MSADFYSDHRGVLGVLDFKDIPFIPQRVFWMAEIPDGETRGHHAHRTCEQFLIVFSGEVTARVELSSGTTFMHQLAAGETLYLATHQWLVLSSFSPDCVLTVLASEPYNEDEYMRDKRIFHSSDDNLRRDII